MDNNFFSSRISERIRKWQHIKIQTTDLLPLAFLQGEIHTQSSGASWKTRFSFFPNTKKIRDVTCYFSKFIYSDIEMSILDLSAECIVGKVIDEIPKLSLREFQSYLQDGHGRPAAPDSFKWKFLEDWLTSWKHSKIMEAWDYVFLGKKVTELLQAEKIDQGRCIHLEQKPFPQIFCESTQSSVPPEVVARIQQKISPFLGEILPRIHFRKI